MITLIQIDDSGSGSLIGGTCIGAMRTETKEYYHEIIPIELYRPNIFDNKQYLEHAVEITKSLLNKLSVFKDEEIEVCRGYMFDRARVWLKENGYNHISTSIEDPLQTCVEATFESYTIGLGLPKQFLNYTKYPFHFHRLLRWVYADYENRYPLCKTGWKSWKKYGSLSVTTSYKRLPKSRYRCLKCGLPIEDNSSVKVLKYISNRPNIIYLHEEC
ncbi:hypothetical protein [Anaerosolibacter sp.]|uniref:hypothetical protein n=1 Tax=Anaerosolibacter sp. TaxID=1872527 RepID=UPI0039F0B29C